MIAADAPVWYVGIHILKLTLKALPIGTDSFNCKRKGESIEKLPICHEEK